MTIIFGEHMRKLIAHSLHILAFLGVTMMVVSLYSGNAMAQQIPVGTCTSANTYDVNYAPSGGGIFSQIGAQITGYILNETSTMYNGIAANTSIVGAAQAAVTLYIAIYGMLFMFGMLQITAFDLIVRLAKIGVVAVILDTSVGTCGNGGTVSSCTFTATFFNFFYGGMNEIIGTMLGSALGGMYNPAQGPFGFMDDAIAKIISPKMAATLIAAFTTGPYGLGIGLVLFMSLMSFVKSLMSAMWVYITASVMLLFLFALAPIFIPCILFESTKKLFDGWIGQIVNAVLQPVFLFAFFSFFVILFESCLDQLFNTPVCWTPLADSARGSAFEGQLWRFEIQACDNSGTWLPFDGTWGWNGPVNTGCDTQQPTHPFGIILPITLWVISDLASRFNSVVVQVAQDISQASVDFRSGIQQLAGQAVSAAGGGGAQPAAATGNSGGGRTGTGGSVAAAPANTSATTPKPPTNPQMGNQRTNPTRK